MKSFEKTVKRRVLLVASCSVLFVAAIVTALILKHLGVGGVDGALSVESLVVMLGTIAVVSSYRIKRYRGALKNPEALEALHVWETDERNRMIGFKTCRATIYTAFTLLGISGILMPFVNKTAYYTIGAVLIVLIILYCIFSLHYSKRY